MSLNKIVESFRDGLASKITAGVFTLAGAAAPFSLWIGNPEVEPMEGGDFLVPVIVCSVSAGIGYGIYRAIHYCCFDMVHDFFGPHPSSGRSYGNQWDNAWRDAGFEDQNKPDNLE